MSCAVRLAGVSVTYQRHLALRDISLEFLRGDFAGIIGPNGAGKTTLLTVINGLGRVRAGSVRILDREVAPRALARLRHRIGYVPQRLEADPRAPLNCRDAVMIGRLGRIGLVRRPGARDREVVTRMMTLAGIGHLADRPVGRVSGGESQKVALARALAQEPDILLLDEPTASLDPNAVRELLGLVTEAHARFGLTTVMVTHRLDHLPAACNRVVMMDRGRVVFAGPKEEALVPERVDALFGHA